MTHAMFKLAVRVALPLLIVLTVASCGQSDSVPPPVTLAETDSGSTVALRQGQTLSVSLPENGSTGYIWETVPGAESVLSAQGGSYVATDPTLSGGGGVRTFTFMAAASGNAVLKIILHQPWMTNVAPARTFEAAIAVVN